MCGAFGLQFGLIMVIICGAELFTGNTAIMAAAFWEGKASGAQVAQNWIVSYLGAGLSRSACLYISVCVRDSHIGA